VKFSEYIWGEYEREIDLPKEAFIKMRKLTYQEILGFDFRKIDRGKQFYGYEDYIDAGPDGIAVKFVYVKIRKKVI
jgi:hypothetical protein